MYGLTGHDGNVCVPMDVRPIASARGAKISSTLGSNRLYVGRHATLHVPRAKAGGIVAPGAEEQHQREREAWVPRRWSSTNLIISSTVHVW